jgi:predicted RNase H-like HicB family nuclease
MRINFMASKDLKDYLNLDYTLVLRRDEEGDWVATVKELEGCIADGSTPEEAIENVQSMKELWLRARLESKRPVPLPENEQEEFSGKFLQRIPKSLHRKLVEVADREGVSLNQLVTSALAQMIGYKQAKAEHGLARAAVDGSWRVLIGSQNRYNWETSGNGELDRTGRNHSIRTLAKRIPTTHENATVRGHDSGTEENHESWGGARTKIAGR